MASSITFSVTDSAIGSFSGGPLNGDTFADALITFTQTTDTTDIGDAGPCAGLTYPCAPDAVDNTVTIAGYGTLVLSGASYFFDNSINLFGITSAVGSAYLAAEGSSFSSYTMTTAISGSFAVYPGSTVSDVALSNGSFLTVSAFGGSVNYQACLDCAATGAPEPGSFGLVLAGAIPLAAGLLRRRKR
jgi:hypothetical protein